MGRLSYDAQNNHPVISFRLLYPALSSRTIVARRVALGGGLGTVANTPTAKCGSEAGQELEE